MWSKRKFKNTNKINNTGQLCNSILKNIILLAQINSVPMNMWKIITGSKGTICMLQLFFLKYTGYYFEDPASIS